MQLRGYILFCFYFLLETFVAKSAKKKTCNECSRQVIDLPRHMRLVHKWSISKSKSVNLIYGKRKTYTWKNGPPQKQNKVRKNGSESKSVADYHKKRRCTFLNCFSVTKRYDQHLKFVHGLDPSSQEYKDKLAEGLPVKDMFVLERIKGDRAARERDEIRRNCSEVGGVPDFRESSASSNIYIAPSKCDLLVIEQCRSKETDNISANADGEDTLLTTDEVLSRFGKFLVSVDGGRLDGSTAKSATRNIRSILRSLDSDDLSDLLDRMNIRNRFLAEFAEKSKFAPLTTKKYLSSLMHFYDFLVNDDLPMINYTADDILRMKVCFFIISL